MKTLLYAENEITYDGTALAPHWIYRRFGILDDALVAFIGPANVAIEHMVDLEDVKKEAPIYSPQMLHFLGEWFHDSLENAVLTQHLLVFLISEWLWENKVTGLTRRGNDIYVNQKKLNVSIATRSPVSVLVHVGINVRTQGTPVPTAGLAELGVDPLVLGATLLKKFQTEWQGWRLARTKVLPR